MSYKKCKDLHPKTAEINKLQQAASKQQRQHVLKWLAEHYPKAFDTEVRINPLKIGIVDDLFNEINALEELPFSKSKLRQALVCFTRRMDYLTALKMRNPRVDLEGNIVAEVTEEEANSAAQRIHQQIAKGIRKRSEDNKKSAPQLDLRPKARQTQQFAKAPALIKVKRRPVAPTMQTDPETVARLKAKLGIKSKRDSEAQ